MSEIKTEKSVFRREAPSTEQLKLREQEYAIWQQYAKLTKEAREQVFTVEEEQESRMTNYELGKGTHTLYAYAKMANAHLGEQPDEYPEFNERQASEIIEVIRGLREIADSLSLIYENATNGKNKKVNELLRKIPVPNDGQFQE